MVICGILLEWTCVLDPYAFAAFLYSNPNDSKCKQEDMNEFKKQLCGLLATLQKLPIGEKQAALDLLQLTLKDQVQNTYNEFSVPEKNSGKRNQSLCQESQDSQCTSQPCVADKDLECVNSLADERVCVNPLGDDRVCVTPRASDTHPLRNDKACVNPLENDQVCVDPLGDDKVLPTNYCMQGTPHSQNLLQEKFPLDILHQLSDPRCIGETVIKVAVSTGKPLSQKEFNATKNEIYMNTPNSKVYEEEYEKRHEANTKPQTRALRSRERFCIVKNSAENDITSHDEEENLSESREMSDYDNIKGEKIDIGHSILTSPENYEEPSNNLNKYESIQELISGQDLNEANQSTTELTSLLEPHDQGKTVDSLELEVVRPNSLENANNLEESDNSHNFGGHLLTDNIHLRVVDVKQGRNEKISGNKTTIFDESSSSSFNLANFHNIDRENLYSEENQYLLPYLERETNFSRKCHEPRELFSELYGDKSPVDLSSVTNLHSSKPTSMVSNDSYTFNYQKSSVRSPITKEYSVEATANTSSTSKKRREGRKLCRKRNKICTGIAKDISPKTNESMAQEDPVGCCEVIYTKMSNYSEAIPEVPEIAVERRHNALPIEIESCVPNNVEAYNYGKNCASSQMDKGRTCHSDPSDSWYEGEKENSHIPSENTSHILPVSIENLDRKTESRQEQPLCQGNTVDGSWFESEENKSRIPVENSACKTKSRGEESLDPSWCGNDGSKEKSRCLISQKSNCDIVRKEQLGDVEKDEGEQSARMLHPVSCRTCRRQVADISQFSAHQRQCIEPRLSCTVCSATFMHKVTYIRHVEGHKRNVCSKCSESFCSHKKLKAHMKSEHNYNLISKLYPCTRCTRKFLKRSSLHYHLKLHATNTEVVCQKCGTFCKDKENFELHMADHIKSTKFHCHICPASFKRRQQYNDHLKLHKKNKCEMCGEPFHTKKALLRHCRSLHKVLPQNALDPEYKCDKCDRVFNRPSHLLQHLQIHSGVKFECTMCDKQFKHKRALRKHLNSVNHEQMLQTNDMEKDHAYDSKQNLDFTCEYCGVKFPTKHLLSKHSRSKHKVGITTRCPHCDYTTTRNHTLKRHMELHKESRNFMCELCGNSYQALATLKDHYKFVHSDERNFSCAECNKRFKNKSSLARHLRIHSEDRPYQCQCGTSYKRLSHLKRHMSSAHNEMLKSRAVKKFKRSEGLDSNTDKSLTGQSRVHKTEYSDGEEYEIASVKDTSNILLQDQESIILMGENSNSDQSHIITVGDSQIIQLIPSTFFTQDSNFQTVSLVSGELHTLPISSSAVSYAESGNQVVVEPFSLSQNSETLVMVPTSQEEQTHIQSDMNATHRALDQTDPLSLTPTRILREPLKHEVKHEISMHSISSHDLSVSGSLDSYDYTGASSSSPAAFPALPPAQYITHTHASPTPLTHTSATPLTHGSQTPLTQDIPVPVLQQNLICPDFIMPVDNNR